MAVVFVGKSVAYTNPQSAYANLKKPQKIYVIEGEVYRSKKHALRVYRGFSVKEQKGVLVFEKELGDLLLKAEAGKLKHGRIMVTKTSAVVKAGGDK